MKNHKNWVVRSLLLTLVLSMGLASRSHAHAFEDEVSAKEAAEAVIHCADEAKQLLQDDEYLGDISGKHAKVSKGVDTKTFVLQSFSGGYMGGPSPKAVAALVITLKVTQAPAGIAAPASTEWSCSLKRYPVGSEN